MIDIINKEKRTCKLAKRKTTASDVPPDLSLDTSDILKLYAACNHGLRDRLITHRLGLTHPFFKIAGH